jgi:hypothetical protein
MVGEEFRNSRQGEVTINGRKGSRRDNRRKKVNGWIIQERGETSICVVVAET